MHATRSRTSNQWGADAFSSLFILDVATLAPSIFYVAKNSATPFLG